MWNQRIYGMEYCFSQKEHSKYLLVCDDDVSFEPDFAEKLLSIAEKHDIDTLVPIQDHRNGFFKNMMLCLLGERTETGTSPFKITIKTNGRYKVNNFLESNVNPTQSGPFQCFLMKTDITPVLNLREEMWLDDTRYAWPDDQVFFYKAYLRGLRTFSCKSPSFKHLDGKSGVTGKQRMMDSSYSHARNIVIFWHRFIKPEKKTVRAKMIAKTSFGYYIAMASLMKILVGLKQRDFSCYKQFRRGICDGRRFVESD